MGLEHFTHGLSRVFKRFADALKPGAPFVFTYHHNKLEAYAPVAVALLDAALVPKVVLPAPAEMSASLHINKTDSSILDSVFVARRCAPDEAGPPTPGGLLIDVANDLRHMSDAGVKVTIGDARCIVSGHLARLAVLRLYKGWQWDRPIDVRLTKVREALTEVAEWYCVSELPRAALAMAASGENSLSLANEIGDQFHFLGELGLAAVV